MIPTVTGLFRGFIRTVFGLLGMISGVVFSIAFARPLGMHLARLLGFTDYFVGKILAFILIFIASAVIGYFGGRLIKHLFSAANLGWVDRILGGLLGLIQGSVVGAVILIIVYLVPTSKPWLEKSVFCRTAAETVVQTAHRLPRDWMDYLAPERWIGASREKILEVLKLDADIKSKMDNVPEPADLTESDESKEPLPITPAAKD